MRNIIAADLFCGAGGTSTGLVQACEEMGRKVRLVAINHWELAVESHSLNHPWADHVCETLDSVDPRKLIRGKLDLLLASPECTHHSLARGGLPMSDQSRATGWHVLRWAEALRPKAVVVENVKEWMTWGPLGRDGRPIKSRKGETFQAWVAALSSLGYRVECRILTAADYGDPTTRQRLFVLARRGGEVRWPQPSHSKEGGALPTWIGSKEVIDWSLAGNSIFGRKRPLAPKTLTRIEAGIQKFGWPAPFLVMLYGNRYLRSLDRPAPTVTTSPGHLALIQPFIIPHRQFKEMRVDSTEVPLRTVTSKNGAGAICRPFVIRYNRTGQPKSVGVPLDTVTTKDRFGLVEGDDLQLDIRFRMLQPHELAGAQGFPGGYRFSGTKADQVRQIGNAVPVNTARALCREALTRRLR